MGGPWLGPGVAVMATWPPPRLRGASRVHHHLRSDCPRSWSRAIPGCPVALYLISAPGASATARVIRAEQQRLNDTRGLGGRLCGFFFLFFFFAPLVGPPSCISFPGGGVFLFLSLLVSGARLRAAASESSRSCCGGGGVILYMRDHRRLATGTGSPRQCTHPLLRSTYRAWRALVGWCGGNTPRNVSGRARLPV